MKKRGRKLMKYREVIKWVIFNHLQYKKTPPMGRRRTDKRTSAFLLYFEKKGKRIKRIMAVNIKGTLGNQSLNTPYKILENESVV